MSFSAVIDGSGNAYVSGGLAVVVGSAAIYRLLEDHYVEEVLLYAGDTVTEGIEIPVNWPPTPNVDPLNTPAVEAFYAVGPWLPGLIRVQWQQRSVPAPVTYWVQISPNQWVLTGSGSDQSIYPPKRVL